MRQPMGYLSPGNGRRSPWKSNAVSNVRPNFIKRPFFESQRGLRSIQTWNNWHGFPCQTVTGEVSRTKPIFEQNLGWLDGFWFRQSRWPVESFKEIRSPRQVHEHGKVISRWNEEPRPWRWLLLCSLRSSKRRGTRLRSSSNTLQFIMFAALRNDPFKDTKSGIDV